MLGMSQDSENSTLPDLPGLTAHCAHTAAASSSPRTVSALWISANHNAFHNVQVTCMTVQLIRRNARQLEVKHDPSSQ